MADEKITGEAGAVPADKGANAEVPTGAEKDAKSESSPEVVVDDKGKPLPWNDQPKWKQARAAEKKLNDLLKANEVEDADDLVELVQKGKAVKGKLADLNQLDAIIEKAQRLEKYEAYWKDQEEKNRRNQEDPQQTIERLEAQLKNKSAAERNREIQRRQSESAKQAIDGYEREVKGLVGELVESKEQRAFVLEFFGVGNPANDIDITDKKAIKKIIADGIKKKEAYDQEIIKAYLKTKDGIPKIGSSSAAATPENKPKIMLADARKMFREAMQRTSGG